MGTWPAIAITAYVVSLAWALAGDIWGDITVIDALRNWQTMVAGLATVSALFYAGRQLRIERHRDRRAYLQQHTVEWQALDAIEADLKRFRVPTLQLVGALAQRRSRMGMIDIDRHRWERLNQLCVPAVDAPLREYLFTAEMHNAFLRQVNAKEGALESWEEDLIEGYIARLTDTSNALATAVADRRAGILSLAPEL